MALRIGPEHTARGEPSEAPTLGDDGLDSVRNRIRALVAVAAANRSTMSPDELRVLLPPGAFAENDDMVRFIETDRVLGTELVVLEGEIAPREDTALIERRRSQRDLTGQRLCVADAFVSSLGRFVPSPDLVAVSGSVAYGGTKLDDDIDFYIVTGPRRLWATLLVAMLMARIRRLSDPTTPIFCFNRLEERDGCREGFRGSRAPLFAREALSLRVLRGAAFYRELLESSAWMETWFPALYRLRLDELRSADPQEASPSSPFWAAVNAAAFLVLGPYLWVAGALRNVRLGHEGRVRAQFRTVVEPAFCAYESRKYDELGDEYRRTFA